MPLKECFLAKTREAAERKNCLCEFSLAGINRSNLKCERVEFASQEFP
ncbi:MAG: hypothetical protein Q7J16_08075 [Candidatus Cloacimonadales bacterium]|nr:hypothetical protein [Candidatus Cloacimonadales bacterium]